MVTQASDITTFGDSISIVNKEGRRKWVYPRKPSGRLYRARTYVSIFLIAILFGLPFIKIDDHPFMLLDIFNRKFIIFGVLFTTGDFYLFGLISVAAFVFLFLLTSVFGRVFCGWICPQTIFLEMVFRKIEYLIEGNYTQQIALNKSPWNRKKIFKKGVKYLIFFAISFIIANIFLAYLIGSDELFNLISSHPREHLSQFISLMIFTGMFYFVFSWFREQACILVCPYGRLQSVLINQSTTVIAYDFKRGEPRGKLKKNDDDIRGDCIDCKLCVYVCPTGIDIRNGTQLECVNCTACIDACNSIMTKVNRPEGLIRYDSMEAIENKSARKLNIRTTGYTVVLLILALIIVVLFNGRKDIDINILRTPGSLFQEQSGNKVSNIYNLKIQNKTFNEIPVDFKLRNTEGEIKVIGNSIVLSSTEIREGSLLILIPKDKITLNNTPLEIDVYSNEKLVSEIKTSFLGPIH